MTVYGPYEIGDQPVITATCKDEAGTLANPTTLTFEVTVNGAKTSYTTASSEVTNPSVGIWKFKHPIITTSATFKVRVVATGAVTDAEQASFTVRPTNQA